MPTTKPKVGELRRHVLLGTEAVYRVVAVEREHVEVEVVDAPGLPAGQRLRLMRRAVEALEVLAVSPAGAGSPREARGWRGPQAAGA